MTRKIVVRLPYVLMHSKTYTEQGIQVAIAATLARLEHEYPERFTFAADQNAAKRGPVARARARDAGMRAGEPDLRLYYYGGGLEMIELKRKGGKLSKEQRERHKRLECLGHRVETLVFATPVEGAQCVGAAVAKRIDAAVEFVFLEA